MAFPNDLTNVKVIKVHPAIGIARVSKSDDFFVFGKDPGNYKSNGLIKRQAVQFRLFAYGENHVGLGELTEDVMNSLGLSSVWSAQVANRKIAFLENVPLSGNQNVISASAKSGDSNQGKLEGSLPTFAEGASIPLGQITEQGVFIPPKAGVYRKTPGLSVPNYPNFTNEIADTTSDGLITCSIQGATNLAVPVLPACIVVAPGDYSPDVDPIMDRDNSLLVRLQQDIGSSSNNTSSQNLHNRTAQEIDDAALRPCTGDFAPGFEVSFKRGEVSNLNAIFFDANQDDRVDPREIRVSYRDSAGAGAIPGQLTSGLCSPWQTDFTACIGYWSENLPVNAFLDEDDQVGVNVYRKRYDDRSLFPETLTNGDDFEQHQDKVGIVRKVDSRLIETERKAGEDLI